LLKFLTLTAGHRRFGRFGSITTAQPDWDGHGIGVFTVHANIPPTVTSTYPSIRAQGPSDSNRGYQLPKWCDGLFDDAT
jgi:hypothetical protein